MSEQNSCSILLLADNGVKMKHCEKRIRGEEICRTHHAKIDPHIFLIISNNGVSANGCTVLVLCNSFIILYPLPLQFNRDRFEKWSHHMVPSNEAI